jgi:hypothetical protein
MSVIGFFIGTKKRKKVLEGELGEIPLLSRPRAALDDERPVRGEPGLPHWQSGSPECGVFFAHCFLVFCPERTGMLRTPQGLFNT